MPGVPSGRGCDACRRSRKKCDEQQPWCLRCVRLGRRCTNSGRQRFVFRPPVVQVSLAKTPSSPTSRLASALISHIEIQDCPSHNLIWTFGDIFRDIPSRLGTYGFLDAAAHALIATSPCLSATTMTMTTGMRAAYIGGLCSLREGLVQMEGSGTRASVPVDVWLAVYLLWICQGWFGLVDDIDPGHARGLLRLWNALAPGSFRGMDGLHRRVVSTMIVPVIFESLFDPTIVLSENVRSLAREIDTAIAGEQVVKLMLCSSDNCTTLNTQIWVAHCGFRIQEVLNPYNIHCAEAAALRDSGQRSLAWLRERINASPLSLPVPGCNPTHQHANDCRHRHATDLRTFSFIAALLLLLNAAELHYTTHHDMEKRSRLAAQQTSLLDDLVRTARIAQRYRPLGSLGSTWALLIAWAALSRRLPAPTALPSSSLAENGPVEAAAEGEELEGMKSEIHALLFQYDVVGINARTHYMLRQTEGMFARLFP